MSKALEQKIEDSDEDLQGRAEQIRSIRKELDKEFLQLLGEKEVSELEMISLFSESVKKKLANHYDDIFPKKCNNCKKIYTSIEEYNKETKSLKRKTTIFDAIGLQEYRNCICGSTLIVWTKERRDVTEYGVARRKLFDECLEKISRISSANEAEVREKLRIIFSSFSA
ncbi:MAG: hypothetical protein AB8G05_07995 [Oligoflexales bacterium]